MAKERAIAMKIIYCRRCAQENFIGDDGLCEDCRELIALRGKVLMKQSRIDGQDAEIKRLREALEYIADTITPSIGSSTVSRSIIEVVGIADEALNSSASGKTRKGGKDE
jgi:hypothetical protein